ncbi:hypothetical protein DFH94DRAFT_683823 [Russula ochroleuca]|uniref:Uncharacterized protein n=1 Tax=Russula ochroleuca TaxID=152965 RepID=A0A9P5MS17_9AGAM|nr:hypothetical protein DFH94DRAFT_683823 [Russula ochroleuca]
MYTVRYTFQWTQTWLHIFGGLAVVIGLKTKWRLSNFVVGPHYTDTPQRVEWDAIAGTWGVTSLVPTLTQRGGQHVSRKDVAPTFPATSTPSPNQTGTTGSARNPEILDYMHGIVDKHGLRNHCRFHTSVDKAEWDADANLWRIETRDVRTAGEKKQLFHATALVLAIDVLVVSRIPKLQGIESFEGEVFHSARWRHNVDLRGKRVGVLGNGSSATQFIPVIAEDPTVTVVNLYARRCDVLHSQAAVTRFAFAHIPLVRPIYRFMIATTIPELHKDYGTCQVSSRCHPDIPFGMQAYCTRRRLSQVIESSERSPYNSTTLHKLNQMELSQQPDNYPLNVRGKRGTLKEYDDAHGGPMAYLGSTVPGFPNFFMISGPNTVTGHTSVIFSEESQVPYLMQFLEPLRAGVLKSVVPTDAATDRYNDMLQERFQDTVWTQYASWCRVGGRGRIVSPFPSPLVLFWWWLRRDFEIDGPGPGVEEWRRYHHVRHSYKALFVTVALAGVLVALVSAVLLGNVEPREISEQAAGASDSPIATNGPNLLGWIKAHEKAVILVRLGSALQTNSTSCITFRGSETEKSEV